MSHAFSLNDVYKQYTADQDKIMPPAETIRLVKAKFNQVDLDILSETIRIDNGRLDIPVFFSSCGKDARRVIGTNKQMGKGATPQQAEASALMELAERFSFFSFKMNPANFKVATYREVKQWAIPFALIARSVHDDGDRMDIKEQIFCDLPMRWCEAVNLTRNEKVLIPFDWFYAINAFNGPSAGNCMEEAIIQGICEVVERHVSALVCRKQLKVPAIKPSSVKDAVVEEMLQKYANAGVNLYLSDFTLDMGIPTVGVMAWDPSTFPTQSEIVWTAGTTPDPTKALSRALTETAQLGGDFNSGANFVASGLPKFNNIKAAHFITNPEHHLDISALPNIANENLRVEIENCLAALAACSMEVYAVDVTHPLLQIPALYTIIPGTHFRERSEGACVGLYTAKLFAENLPPDQTLAVLRQMDEHLPGQYYVSFYRGLCQQAQGEHNAALAAFEQAQKLSPPQQDFAAICAYMGISLKEMGAYREALAMLAQGLETDVEQPELLNLVGVCHFKLKEHHQAIEAFEAALHLNPGSAIDYANIAVNYRELGNTAEAIRYYETALALDSSIDFARQHLNQLRKSS